MRRTFIILFLNFCGLLTFSSHAQTNLSDTDMLYKTHLGSVVIYKTPSGLKAFRYAGQLAFDLDRAPDEKRGAIRQGLAVQLGIPESQLDKMLSLTALSWPGNRNDSRQPVFAPRELVYPFEEAKKLDPGGVEALGIPPMVTNPKRIMAVTQVPVEIARSPEYKAEQAKKRSEAEAVAAVLALDFLASRSLTPGESNSGGCYMLPPYGTTGTPQEYCPN